MAPVKRKRRTTSPMLAVLALVAIGAATLFGDRVPILNEVAGYLSELVGGGSQVSGPQVSGLMGPAEVLKVSDGDTVHVLLEGTDESVRLIGVDTPEKFSSAKLTKDAEASPLSVEEIQKLGKEASAYTENLLAGREVYVQVGVEERDRYRRLLAYLYVLAPGGDWTFDGQTFTQVNLELARAGWADPLTIPPNVDFAEEYVAAAREARAAGRGMWGRGVGSARVALVAGLRSLYTVSPNIFQHQHSVLVVTVLRLFESEEKAVGYGGAVTVTERIDPQGVLETAIKRVETVLRPFTGLPVDPERLVTRREAQRFSLIGRQQHLRLGGGNRSDFTP